MHSIIFHAHQKLDRVAHRHLGELKPGGFFPTTRQILHFEAGHGPDGAKLKRQKKDQPWHFVDPHDVSDTQIHKEIQHHFDGLTLALTERNDVRAAFEAAWLAHALVDGLTPAHHHPYEKELAELRGGQDRHSRKGLAGRLYVKGDTMLESVQQSLKLVGPKGLLTSHAMFEAGAFTLIAPLKMNKAMPSTEEIEGIINKGVTVVFSEVAREIAEMEIYARFCARGWTQTISQDVRKEMAPRMVRMITLAWYAASHEAETAAA